MGDAAEISFEQQMHLFESLTLVGHRIQEWDRSLTGVIRVETYLDRNHVLIIPKDDTL